MNLAWLARVAGARARSELRLLLVVLAVAVASCTLISSLALLFTVTQEGGLRAALGDESTRRSRIEVTVVDPTEPIADAESAVASSVGYVLADAVPIRSSVFAQTGFTLVPDIGDELPVLAYLAELDDVASEATIVDGAWPGDATGQTVPVAIPEEAADALELGVGQTFTVAEAPTPLEIVGVYRILQPDGDYWSPDLLAGAGIDRGFPLPDTRAVVPTDAIGPVVVARQTLDSAALDAAVDVQFLDIRFQPDFRTLGLDDLGVISDRLHDARTRVPDRAGRIGERVTYSSQLSRVVDETASGLLVTRTIVISVGLLLLLVALVALTQSGRLVTESRADEGRLLRARGASLAGIRGMSSIEVGAIVVLTAGTGPLLAMAGYRLISAHPAMRAAGMPPDAGSPPLVWGIAVGVSAVFALVLLAPLARPAELFDDDRSEQRASRRIGASGIARLPIDIAIAAFAVVLSQQLVAYRAPVGVPSVRIDPILVVAPALLLAACAFLAMRLVPLVATIIERVGSRSRGAVLPLAAWEVGRRARRATAIVLLLTLALGVGSFGSTFLATWRQSQIDQVEFAFGAPVRVPADAALGAAQATALAEGALDDPQPVLRRLGQVAAPSGGGFGQPLPRGVDTQVLGLTTSARGLLDRSRVGDEGGSAIERMLRSEPTPARAIALPASADGIGAMVRIGDAVAAWPGVVGVISAIVESADGLLGTVEIGSVPVDGGEYAIQGLLPGASADADADAGADTDTGDDPDPGVSSDGGNGTGTGTGAGPGTSEQVDLVGLIVDFAVADASVYQPRSRPTRADVLVRDVAALLPAPGTDAATTARPLSLSTAESWASGAVIAYSTPPQLVPAPAGWELDLRVSIPQEAEQGSVFSLVGWDPPDFLPVVVTDELADLMTLRPDSSLTLVASGVPIPARLVGTVPLVPGSSRAPTVSGSVDDGATSETSSVLVVDQVLLGRALVGAGIARSPVDEWWVDVAPGDGEQYLDLHGDRPEGAGAESSEVVALAQTEGPLRVAVPAALWLVIASSVTLTVVGFAVHAAASMRARRTEFAQLRAIGLARRSLVGIIGAESALISLLGTVFGIAIGVLLGSLVAPLVGLSPDGSAPQPSVVVVIPVVTIAALAVVVAVVVVGVVLGVAGRQRSADPAGILRGADG